MTEVSIIDAPFDLMNIDKSGWKPYRFNQIAFNISERVEPKDTDLEIYVGLEHLDPESIHIKRWGKPSDVEGTKLKVYPGYIIFGKRRAYQRKAALANFEGICSAHAMVLRPNRDVIEPDLFPFFLHSDTFMHRAVDISVGSLSPTINWKTLAVQEFLLPPKEQQAKLAELLWAADDVIEKNTNLITTLKDLASVTFDSVYDYKDIKFLKLGDCLEYSQYGISEQLNDTGELPVLRMNNLVNGQIDLSDLKYINKSSIINLQNLLLENGDILFNRTNSYDLVGKVGIYEHEREATFASYLIRLKANQDIVLPKYLNLYLNSIKGQSLIKIHRTPGVSQSNINPENLKKISVPVVNLKKQQNIVEKVSNVEHLALNAEKNKQCLKSALKIYINQIFP